MQIDITSKTAHKWNDDALLTKMSSTLSTEVLQSYIGYLKVNRHRQSTQNNYYTVWRCFNQIFIQLDRKPNNWEDRLMLFVAFLINKRRKSSIIKSYISAIKAILFNGGVILNSDQVLLSTLTKVCHLNNDRLTGRIPIRKDLLGLLLDSIDTLYLKTKPKPYLAVMFKALLATAYYGLFRIGELTNSVHVVKVVDVHIATNKNKLMFVLHSSKTHGRGDKPQIIKISAVNLSTYDTNNSHSAHCPFHLLRLFLAHRKMWWNVNEQFFVFLDRSPVEPSHLRQLLTTLLKMNNLNHHLYSPAGLRAGHTTDLAHLGLLVETIKKLGRWKSSAVYTYLRF